MSDIDKVIEALRRSFLYQINCELTDAQSKILLDHIAELEAEVLELKPYRDGYDATKVFPPEGQWVWLRDCDDNIEPVQYDHKAGFYWNYGINPDDDPIWYWEPDNGDLVRWYPIGKLPEERKK